MPIRLIRDGILSSEAVCSLAWPAEVFYRRLMSAVDDFGRFSANPRLLRSACYPLQIDKVSDADIEKWLTECVEAALVSVYPAEDGKRYLEICKFGQQVRAKNSKYPEPPSGSYSHRASVEPLKTSASNCSQMQADEGKSEKKVLLRKKRDEICCKHLLSNAHLDEFGDGDDIKQTHTHPRGRDSPPVDNSPPIWQPDRQRLLAELQRAGIPPPTENVLRLTLVRFTREYQDRFNKFPDRWPENKRYGRLLGWLAGDFRHENRAGSSAKLRGFEYGDAVGQQWLADQAAREQTGSGDVDVFGD